MRIAFLCGGLEPGRDGVGDYTRRLAGECARQGHACALIALRDRHLKQPAEIEISSDDTQILRLPAGMPWPDRIERAAAFRARFGPEWASLQFVPYAHDEKGIVVEMADSLRKIVGESPRLHIMLHELWIGAAAGASLKHRIVGAAQRHYILKMLRRSNPKAMATSNPTYQAMLQRHGIRSDIFPLFGNIPVAPAQDRSRLAAATLRAGGTDDWIEPANRAVGVFFGAIPAQWTPEPLLSVLARAAHGAGKALHLVSAGRLDQASELQWESMNRRYAPDISFTRLGEQPDTVISLLLQAADFGIATAPLELIGKSGAAAAMLEHGLPVIVNRDDWHLRGGRPDTTPDSRLFLLDAALEDRFARGLPKTLPREMLGPLASAFLASLHSSSQGITP